ncbi:MAG: heavy-metal-associated domain-containing protein [Bacteroidales bacterium]
MKRSIPILLLAIALSACQGSGESRTAEENYPEPAVEVAAENMATISFDVEGMTCPSCENTVKQSLERIEGVVEAQASHLDSLTVVQYDKSRVTAEEMEEAIVSRGYKVTGHSPRQ